jgi:hypothetical protein
MKQPDTTEGSGMLLEYDENVNRIYSLIVHRVKLGVEGVG